MSRISLTSTPISLYHYSFFYQNESTTAFSKHTAFTYHSAFAHSRTRITALSRRTQLVTQTADSTPRAHLGSGTSPFGSFKPCIANKTTHCVSYRQRLIKRPSRTHIPAAVAPHAAPRDTPSPDPNPTKALPPGTSSPLAQLSALFAHLPQQQCRNLAPAAQPPRQAPPASPCLSASLLLPRRPQLGGIR